MNGKITLITPPDIWENENISVLLINLTEQEQENISAWLSKQEINKDINMYLYEGQPDMAWLLHAVNRCSLKYLNLDNSNTTTQAIGGYILGKSGVFYSSRDKNLAAIFSHINNNKIDKIEKFLERILVE